MIGYLVDALFSGEFHVKCSCGSTGGHIRQSTVRFAHESGMTHCERCLPAGKTIQVFQYTYRPAISVSNARRVYKDANRITSFVHNGGRVICLRPLYKRHSSLPRSCVACQSRVDELFEFCSLQCALQHEGAEDSCNSPHTPGHSDVMYRHADQVYRRPTRRLRHFRKRQPQRSPL